VIYFIVAYGYPFVVRVLPRSRYAPSELRLIYLDGRGILREALATCARRGFSISDVSINDTTNGRSNGHGPRQVAVELEVRGQGSLAELATELHELDGVVKVHAGDSDELSY
jgi:putative Mg2+ transporter-C (MgtC) family protein